MDWSWNLKELYPLLNGDKWLRHAIGLQFAEQKPDYGDVSKNKTIT